MHHFATCGFDWALSAADSLFIRLHRDVFGGSLSFSMRAFDDSLGERTIN